jgi:hypothetical protein
MTSVAEDTLAAISHVPNALGRFGRYGGRFVPETLMFALDELDAAYRGAIKDPAFPPVYGSGAGASSSTRWFDRAGDRFRPHVWRQPTVGELIPSARLIPTPLLPFA